MQITKVEPMVLSYPEPNDADALRMTVLVRVSAGGVDGWGECIAMWPEACAAIAALIDGGMADVVIGADPLDTHTAWRALKRHSWWYGEGGLASMAIAGIDMAIWDLRGKLSDQPLHALLGGRAHASLPVIASMHVNKATTEENVREIVGHIEAGFTGAKLGFGKKGRSHVGQDPEHDVAFVKAVREGLGPAPELMIDIGAGVTWDLATAINTTRRFEEQNIAWIEEPLHPSDIAGYRALRDVVNTPIATGEREWTVDGYRRLIETDTVDVFGVDPARAEGITGFRKIAEDVGDAGKTINAHAWSTAVTTAASLHLSITTPHARLFELKPLPSPMQHEIVEAPIWHDNGRIDAPDAPGLGITLREAAIESYRVS